MGNHSELFSEDFQMNEFYVSRAYIRNNRTGEFINGVVTVSLHLLIFTDILLIRLTLIRVTTVKR